MSLTSPLPNNTRIFTIYDASNLKPIYQYPSDDMKVLEGVNDTSGQGKNPDPLMDTTLLMRRLGQLSNMVPAETSPYFPHQFCLNHCTGNGSYAMTTLIIPHPGIYLVYSLYRLNSEKIEKKKVKRERSNAAVAVPAANTESKVEPAKEKKKKEIERPVEKAPPAAVERAPGSAEKKVKKTTQPTVVRGSYHL